MEIQSSTQGFSFDTLGSAGGQSGTKDDMFAQMIARMMDTSSAKRQENTQQADSRRAARSASQDDQDARAADKSRAAKTSAEKTAADKAEAGKANAERANAERAADKADARTRLTGRSDAIPAQPADTPAPAPRTAETERPVPARTDAGKPAPDKPAAKPATKADSGKPADKPSTGEDAAAPKAAAPTDETSPDDTAADPALDGEILTGAAADDDASKTVVIEAQVTIVETTVEVITPTQHFAMTMAQGTGTLSVSADDGGQATDADAMTAKAADPAAAQTAAAGTLPAGARPMAAPLDGKAPHLPADAKPQDAAAKTDAPSPDTPGLIPADALPTDDSVELPESIAGLFQNAGQGSGALKDAAAKGQGGASGNPHGQQPQQQPFADPAALNPQGTATAQATASATRTAFEAVAATVGADTAQPLAATRDAAAADPTQAVMAPIDGVKTTAAAEGIRPAAAMHPSRGTAAMPQGVPDQISVNIQKAVKDGKDHFSIRLNPEDLGRIDIRLEIAQDGRLQANISVEKAQTLELLQRDQRSLESALNGAGLKADSDSLNFSLHSDGKPFADENNPQDGGRRGRGRGSADPDEQAEQDAAIIHTLTLGPGRFDVRV